MVPLPLGLLRPCAVQELWGALESQRAQLQEVTDKLEQAAETIKALEADKQLQAQELSALQAANASLQEASSAWAMHARSSLMRYLRLRQSWQR